MTTTETFMCRCDEYCWCHPDESFRYGCADIQVKRECDQPATQEDMLCDDCREEREPVTVND